MKFTYGTNFWIFITNKCSAVEFKVVNCSSVLLKRIISWQKKRAPYLFAKYVRGSIFCIVVIFFIWISSQRMCCVCHVKAIASNLSISEWHADMTQRKSCKFFSVPPNSSVNSSHIWSRLCLSIEIYWIDFAFSSRNCEFRSNLVLYGYVGSRCDLLCSIIGLITIYGWHRHRYDDKCHIGPVDFRWRCIQNGFRIGERFHSALTSKRWQVRRFPLNSTLL